MPLEIAGMDTDLHSNLLAKISVLSTAEWSRSTLSFGVIRSLQTGPTAWITYLQFSLPPDVYPHCPVLTIPYFLTYSRDSF